MSRLAELTRMRQRGYMTVNEAAQLIGVHPHTVRRAIRKERLRHLRFYGHIYIHKEHARRYTPYDKSQYMRRVSLEKIRDHNDSTGRYMTGKLFAHQCGITYQGALWRIRQLRKAGLVIWLTHIGCWITDAGRRELR